MKNPSPQAIPPSLAKKLIPGGLKNPLPATSPLHIDKLIPGGQGIATSVDGKKGLFWNVLPDEIVTEYLITRSKSTYFEAIATKIENPSPHRISPRDHCYLSTSPWQIFDYDYELTEKRALLVESFRQAGLSPEIPSVQTDGQDFFYRNKMEYSLFWDNQTAQIMPAFHQRGSHRKLPITSSSLERPEIYAKAVEIIQQLNQAHEPARKYQSLLLRCNQQGIVSGGLYENHQPHPIFDNLQDTILGKPYSYSPNGFFQINLPVYELALQEIRRHIHTAKVLDLYAGVGTIGLSVASRDVHELTLVESDPSAFAELEKNCQSAHTISNFTTPPRPVLAKSEKVLDFIQPDTTVILDPPRAGCDDELLERLNQQTPPTVIYLSCNPATQARDLAILSQKYAITRVQPFNFFPRTPHLENLVILELI